MAACLRLSGPLDIAQLEHGIQTLVNRHESLRTRMERLGVDDQSTQIIDPPHEFHLPIIDLSRSAADSRNEAARQIGKEFISESIDLRQGPVFDARLVKLAPCEHVLMLGLDHIVSDATSYPILTNEVIWPLIDHPNEMPLVPRVQFPDYAVWQHRTDDTWRREHEPYWREKLSNIERITIPPDFPSPHPPLQTSNRVVNVPFGKRLTSELRRIARQERCLLPLLVLSLYLVAMSRWCERNDLLVSFLTHGRHGDPDLKRMIGCIAYPVFLRVKITVHESVGDLLTCLTSELQSSFTHDASRVPATGLPSDDPTDVVFNWLPTDWGLSGTHASALRQSDKADEGITVRPFPLGDQLQEGVKFAPFFTDTPSGILLVVWYGSDLLLRETVQRFTAHLMRLVEIFVTDPNITIGGLNSRI